MKKILKYLFGSAIGIVMCAAGLSACTDERLAGDMSTDDSSSFTEEGYLRVSTTMVIPQMTSVTSRASLWDTPDYDGLQLYALVFEDGGGLRQYAKIESEKHQTDGEHSHSELVNFTVTLQPTDKNTVIHLIATNQPKFEETITFGTEERVISSLYTDRNYEAYWQRLDLQGYIPSLENMDPTHESYRDDAATMKLKVESALSHVPMVRNFCRVSVDDALVSDHFVLTGLYVINTVDRGSVAPYVADNEPGRRFVEYYKTSANGGYEGRSYNEISAQNHVGTLPVGVNVINNNLDDIATKSEGENGLVNPVYFYERPARENSTERTYAIIRGKYAGSSDDSYYKIDLGRISNSVIGQMAGIFEYYNLLRNFDYVIRLMRIESEGYGSLADAAKGPVYNNFSAAIEARNMFSISDGKEMLNVNHLTFVFTKPNQTIELRAQYRNNIDNGLGGETDNENLHIELGEGDVIERIVDTENPTTVIGDDGLEWNSYEVFGRTPDDILHEQLVYVYRGVKDDGNYGLYRVLHFYSHTPWSFNHIGIFPGLWQNMNETPNWDWDRDERDIGQLKGSNLTLFFELPSGLPQAIFPLKFIIESDRQNIQNAYQGNAVVQSVPAVHSLFYDEHAANPNDNPKTSRIQYVKTVTWEEYYGDLSEENIGLSTYIVRCPFLTITDLNQEGIGNTETGRSKTTLRVKNDYFGTYDDATGEWIMYQQDDFIRDKSTSDPSPRNWNFSNQYWDNVMFNMTTRYDMTFSTTTDRYPIYTADNNNTDELVFVDGCVKTDVVTTTGATIRNIDKPTLTNAIDNNGLRYVQTTNAGDKFVTTLMYGINKARTMRLTVSSTDKNGVRTAPTVTLTSDPLNLVTLPAAKTGVAQDGYPAPYIYDIAVPLNVKEVKVEISPSTSDSNMRFYQIEVYPRWDSFQSAIQ